MKAGVRRASGFWLIQAALLTVCFPAAALQSYFINNEVRSDNIELFHKWTGMLGNYHAESHTLDGACGKTQYSRAS